MKKKIKLSNAILEGSKIRGKTNGALFEKNKSCALGAAYEYLFDKLTSRELLRSDAQCKYDKLNKYYPELTSKKFYKKELSLFDRIMRLNDYSGWSRQKIAEWLKAMGL